MRRFFFDPSQRLGNEVLLSEEESRHIVRVLRLDTGCSVGLLDGHGRLFSGEIVELGKQVRVAGMVEQEVFQESGPELHVGMGLLKGRKMELLVQKCTELGVASFEPFFSSRCQGRIADDSQAGKKQERWQRIAEEACKQCGRLKRMSLPLIKAYSDILGEKNDKELKLLFWEEEKKLNFKQFSDFSGFQKISLLLGPEGGFSGEEVEQAKQSGYQVVSMGPRILRAETACIVAVSIAQFLCGKMEC